MCNALHEVRKETRKASGPSGNLSQSEPVGASNGTSGPHSSTTPPTDAKDDDTREGIAGLRAQVDSLTESVRVLASRLPPRSPGSETSGLPGTERQATPGTKTKSRGSKDSEYQANRKTHLKEARRDFWKSLKEQGVDFVRSKLMKFRTKLITFLKGCKTRPQPDPQEESWGKAIARFKEWFPLEEVPRSPFHCD